MNINKSSAVIRLIFKKEEKYNNIKLTKYSPIIVNLKLTKHHPISDDYDNSILIKGNH